MQMEVAIKYNLYCQLSRLFAIHSYLMKNSTSANPGMLFTVVIQLTASSRTTRASFAA
jgi:hypothetical protein